MALSKEEALKPTAAEAAHLIEASILIDSALHIDFVPNEGNTVVVGFGGSVVKDTLTLTPRLRFFITDAYESAGWAVKWDGDRFHLS
ncbi:hypothetical protein L6258_00845 [Candidatus Parcubacteria bacterium]|nr:hypothetical protein [Candidatus Parcubacteria bacterium]